MEGARVRTYRELQIRVEALPPPKPGYIRVYRGQDQNYPLVPSARRRPVPRDGIWTHYVRRIISSLEGSRRSGHADYEIELGILWLQALAQHYGAGSNYLDVTHDLGIATWFAFHKSTNTSSEIPAGGEGPERDLMMRMNWCRLLPHADPGYLYAFDLKPWMRENIPESGQLVDLADAPPTFQSPRITAQAGCLVYAEENEDLARALVPGTPIVMKGGFNSSPYARWSVEQLFPPPASDPWYARLLSLPFFLGPDDERTVVCLTQSLPVTLFLSPAGSAYEADIRRRFQYVSPLLIHPELKFGEGAEEIQIAFERATVLVLEGPQISAHPAVDDPSWNHGLLMSDWSLTVETFDFTSETATGRAGLDNVIIQFSPLEVVGWDEAGIKDGELRALWLVRHDDDTIAVCHVRQGRVGCVAGETLLVRFNSRRQRLECQIGGEDSAWEDITALGQEAKPILSSLVLLRDLSPVPKVASYARIDITIPSKGTTYYLSVSSSAARLVRATASKDLRPWYVVRHPAGDPYTTARENAGFVEIHTTKPFADLAADQVRQFVLATTEARRPLLDSALSHASHGPEQLDAWLDRTPAAREAGFLADVTRFAIDEQRRGSDDTALSAHILAGCLCGRAGNVPGKLSHQLESARIILSARTHDAYLGACGRARGTAEEALGHHDDRRAFLGFSLAATGAYLAALDADDPDEEGSWLREALAALLEMERLEITAEETPPWYQFVNGVAAVYDSIVTQESDSEADALTSELGRLAALAEQLIPVDFKLEDPQRTLDASRKLADLSERYGDPAVAAARRVAMDLPGDSSV
jgi:hypothetical protein